MKFKTYYGEKKVVFSEIGDKYEPERQLMVNESGKKKLEVTGSIDTEEAIASYYPEVDMTMILARLEAGDESVLERAKGFYADVSDLPVRLQDVMNLNIRAEKFFAELPQDLKNLYGNDFTKFLLDPGVLVDELNIRKKNELEEIVEEEVKNDDKEQ